jgi:hypothetical protein
MGGKSLVTMPFDLFFAFPYWKVTKVLLVVPAGHGTRVILQNQFDEYKSLVL